MARRESESFGERVARGTGIGGGIGASMGTVGGTIAGLAGKNIAGLEGLKKNSDLYKYILQQALKTGGKGAAIGGGLAAILALNNK